jgi:hypothetical protein
MSQIPPRAAERRLADSLPVLKLPHWAGESIIIGNRVQLRILESLWHQSTCLRVVAHLSDLSSIDVLVEFAVEVDLNGDSRREIELAVEGAGAVTRCHGGRGAELVDPGGAGGWAVKALLDAVALVFDFGEGEVDFGDDAGDVEAFDIWGAVLVWWSRELRAERGVFTANAALVGDFEVGADTGLGITVADCERPGCDADGENGSSDSEG